MADSPGVEKKPVRQILREKAISAPWYISSWVFRLLYGFHIEGAEHILEQGPYIVALNEQSAIAMLLSGYISIVLLKEAYEEHPDDTVAYMQEELWGLPYFRTALTEDSATEMRALVPHSAGRLALNLLDGYRALRNGGLVVMNPEGDATWDGRPLPHGAAMAWLALHTAAPVLPLLTNIGCYEIWPRWQMAPSLRGQLKITVGKPFRLTDEPLRSVTDEQVEEGRARIQAAFEPLAYGPGGVKEWMGPALRDGVPVQGPIELRSPPDFVPPRDAFERALKRNGEPVAVRNLGVAQLLWRCPVCHSDGALVHNRPRFRSQTVNCRACGTRWQMGHTAGKDFRLKVVEGSPDLVGLDMPLTSWYDEMKAGFQAIPISVSGVDLQPGEEVYLERNDVPLSPYRPSPLFEGWTGREPPQTVPPGRREYAAWDSIGEGRLLLTSHRLVWQGEQGELDFHWSSVTAVYLWLMSTLAVKYGAASYRFDLGDVFALKWLFHAGTLAQRQGELDGRKVTVSYF